jgi:hypothetical protein
LISSPERIRARNDAQATSHIRKMEKSFNRLKATPQLPPSVLRNLCILEKRFIEEIELAREIYDGQPTSPLNADQRLADKMEQTAYEQYKMIIMRSRATLLEFARANNLKL